MSADEIHGQLKRRYDEAVGGHVQDAEVAFADFRQMQVDNYSVFFMVQSRDREGDTQGFGGYQGMKLNLDSISEKDFREHVKETITKYGEKLEPYDLKRYICSDLAHTRDLQTR